jgi:hypothetical protein
MFVGQVVSIESVANKTGLRDATITFKDGPLGGPGDDRIINILFWPGDEMNLLSNKCYLFRGTVILNDDTNSAQPLVSFLTLPIILSSSNNIYCI